MTIFPLILLALAFGLLIFLQTVLVDAVSVQSRRLEQMTRQLRELSEFVRQQAPPIGQLSQEGNAALTEVSSIREIIEDSEWVYGDEHDRAA